MKKIVLVLLLGLCLCACQQMGPTQVGVRFRKLPSDIGPVSFGGVAPRIVAPGQLAILMPWDSIYTFDTSVRDVSWPRTEDVLGKSVKEGFVNTRALDGNEVALAITVRYRVNIDPEKLAWLIQTVATNDAEVRELVISVARADIRTYMNELKTSAFLDEASRFAAVDKVRTSMQKRLSPYGIDVQAVILDDFRFERLLRDGTVDASYQEKITQIQKLQQDTEREKSRIETVKAKKLEEFNTVQAAVNRQIAESEGYKKQAALRGDGYYESKLNEAKGILATGRASVEGLKQQIDALSGPGAAAILKLEIARHIMQGDPKFVVVNQPNSSNSMNVQKLDTNQVLGQLGLMDAMSAAEKKAEKENSAAGSKTEALSSSSTKQ